MLERDREEYEREGERKKEREREVDASFHTFTVAALSGYMMKAERRARSLPSPICYDVIRYATIGRALYVVCHRKLCFR